MKRILARILLVFVGFALLVTTLAIPCTASDVEPEQIQPQPVYMISEVTCATQHLYVYFDSASQTHLEDAIAKISSYKTYLELKKESLPTEAQDYALCVFMLDSTINELQAMIDVYQEQIVELEEEAQRWAKKAKEYPIATYVWLYMKNNFGWSDVVCAGVMGNIMGEIGRDMKFEKWNHRIPYGMFQWLGGRRQDIHRIYGEEPSIDEQLEFMFDELYGTDGVRQQLSDAKREKILNGKTPESVAQMFCDWFERPGGTGRCRQGYARRAYEYFTS